MKKILASLVALAMFVSVATVMVGCGAGVNGEYKYSHATFTVITKVDEETGKVTETKTYSEQEYAKICYVWQAIDPTKTAADALAVELDEDQTKGYNELLESVQKKCRRQIMFNEMDADEVRMTLKNGKAKLVGTEDVGGELTYGKTELTIQGTYEVKEDVMYFRVLDMEDEGCYEGLEEYKQAAYAIYKLNLTEDNGAVMSEYYSSDADYDYTGKEFSAVNAMVIYRTDLHFVEA